jgi:long-chain fatty acid transport protein
MKGKVLSILLILLMAGWAGAGGFELYEFGAASSAMAGAVVARAWDASTVFYNPSGIAFLEDGAHFYGGVTFISATNKYTGAEPIFHNEQHQSVDFVHTPIGFYFTYQFNESMYAGIGVTNPFGLGLDWQEDFPGRSIAYNTDLKSFYISPVFAYKVMDELSLSVGLDIVLGSITLQRYVRMFDSEGSPGIEAAKSTIEGSSNVGYGFTASMQYRTENLGLGFLYRHSVENKLENADATFSYLDTYARPVAEAILVDQKVNSGLTFPNFFSVGIYYKFFETFGAEVDFMWYNWSVFDELLLEFEDQDNIGTVVIPENYENSIQFRLGLHYDFAENWQLRAGYIYDQTPQPIESVSPLLPDNDRNDYSIGLGYTLNTWQFDAGYMLVDFGERSTVEDGVGKNHDGFNGTYATTANLFFISFGYHFE